MLDLYGVARAYFGFGNFTWPKSLYSDGAGIFYPGIPPGDITSRFFVKKSHFEDLESMTVSEVPQDIKNSSQPEEIVAGGGIRSDGKLRMDKEMSNQEDLQLLASISQGDEKSLAMLYDKYARLIYSLTLRIVRNEDEARELQQDVFLQVWHKAGLFDNERGSFVTWLVTLAHNKSINTLRSRRYKKSALEVKQDIADITSDSTTSHHTPLTDVLESDERRTVLAALDQIPELQRKALYLSYYEGYSQSEIAEMLGEPLGTIKTRMRKGMMKLVEILGDGKTNVRP